MVRLAKNSRWSLAVLSAPANANRKRRSPRAPLGAHQCQRSRLAERWMAGRRPHNDGMQRLRLNLGLGITAMKTTEATFPELAQVDKKTWRFWKKYISHWFRYPLFFFRKAPVMRWWDLFGSAHRVAWDCARAESALENEPDIWNRGALRGRFMAVKPL